MEHEFNAWPFPVLKPEAEWDEFEREFVGFMRAAYAENFRPQVNTSFTEIVAGDWPGGRSVDLVWRGRRNGWEPWLNDGHQGVRLGPHYGLDESACVCIRPPFRAVAHFALEWLRGRSLKSLLDDFIFFGGRPPQGIELKTAPNPWRLALEIRRPALEIKSAIDKQRRALPQSPGKAFLRNARLDLPVKQPDGNWLVYECAGQWKVTYSESTRDYTLIDAHGEQRTFADVASLSTFFEGREQQLAAERF